MDSDEWLNTIEFLNTFSNPDSDINWISPVYTDVSRNYLTALPAVYDDVSLAETGTSDTGQQDDTYRVLDVGCGDCTFTREVAASYDADVIGIDLAPKYGRATIADYETETGRENATIIGGDFSELLPELEPANFIYAVNVLQATDNPRNTTELLYDALKDGGYVAVTLPGDSAADLFSKEHQHIDSDTELPYISVNYSEFDVQLDQYLFPNDTAETLFKDAGFNVEQRTLPASTDGLNEILEHSNATLPDDTDVENLAPEVDLYILEK